MLITLEVIMEVTSHYSLPCPFESGSAIGVYGPSRAGKSTFIKKLIEYKDMMFTREPQKIMYCYAIWSKDFENMDGVLFNKGLPDLETIQAFSEGEHSLLVLDDLIHEVCKSGWADQIFTTASHHLDMTVVFISQNLFPQGKNMRNIALNLTYIVLFRSPRDVNQVGVLGSQLGERKNFLAAYIDSTKSPYGYLTLDFTPKCIEELRWRTNIFPGELVVTYT